MRSSLLPALARRSATIPRSSHLSRYCAASSSSSLVSSSFHSTTAPAATTTAATDTDKNWADPARRQYKYWNPQSTKRGQYSYLIEMSPESIATEAKIVSLSAPDDVANEALHRGPLVPGATLLGVGTTVDEVRAAIAAGAGRNNSGGSNHSSASSTQPNVLFVSPSCPHAAAVLPAVLQAYPSIRWVHCRSAGIDFIESDALAAWSSGATPPGGHPSHEAVVTNAKGQFSSSLAEYALAACSYFAKDFNRLARQQKAKRWENYDIENLCVVFVNRQQQRSCFFLLLSSCRLLFSSLVVFCAGTRTMV